MTRKTANELEAAAPAVFNAHPLLNRVCATEDGQFFPAWGVANFHAREQLLPTWNDTLLHYFERDQANEVASTAVDALAYKGNELWGQVSRIYP